MTVKNGEERRNKLLGILSRAEEPISGSRLSKMLNVSRQVIITDIALLRTSHPDLIATSTGYVLMGASGCRRIFKVNHTDEQLGDELKSIVDLGGTILDVFIEHRVYGTIRKPLNICSRRDVGRFMEDIGTGVSTPLKNITHGYHYHTVEARSPEVLDEIQNMLREKGYLISTSDAPTYYEPKKYNQ